jgi:hypothetical protein
MDVVLALGLDKVAGIDKVVVLVAGIDKVVGLVAGIGKVVGLVAGIGKVVGLVAGNGKVVGLVAGIGKVVELVAGIGKVVGLVAGIAKSWLHNDNRLHVQVRNTRDVVEVVYFSGDDLQHFCTSYRIVVWNVIGFCFTRLVFDIYELFLNCHVLSSESLSWSSPSTSCSSTTLSSTPLDWCCRVSGSFTIGRFASLEFCSSTRNPRDTEGNSSSSSDESTTFSPADVS